MGPQPIKMAILAMGGEGGGVLADWIVDLGEHNGHIAQTTSVPGVAQRTGATIYYVELFPKAQAERDGAQPVLALMPSPGDVDVVLASELMEAGRAVQRGFVTPDRTTLIASTHRVYSIGEKIALGDGRADSATLLKHADRAAKRFVRFDMAQAAEAAGSVISAVLFGALAGTGVLPFSREQFEATIERGGVGVKPSLRAFGRGLALQGEGGAAHAEVAGPTPQRDRTVGLQDESSAAHFAADGAVLAAPNASALDGTTDAPAPAAQKALQPVMREPRDPATRALLQRIERDFPASAQPTLIEGVRRLVDYQDPAYAEHYLDRLTPLTRFDGAQAPELLTETARHLALWMSYEDTIRVAEMKTRAARFDRVRSEVRADVNQLLAINEFLHPRREEILEMLPAGLARWLDGAGWRRGLLEHFTRRGRIVTTSSIRGFSMLYLLAGMKRWRRRTLRFAAENARIEQWLARIHEAAQSNPGLALEVAQCQRLVKGYSDTHARGLRNFETVMSVVQRAGAALAPATLRELRDAALADEYGHALNASLARHALA